MILAAAGCAPLEREVHGRDVALHVDTQTAAGRSSHAVFASTSWRQFLEPSFDGRSLEVVNVELDPTSGEWRTHRVELAVERILVNVSASVPGRLFVLSQGEDGASVIERWNVESAAGGFRAERALGGPTHAVIVGGMFVPPERRGPARVERSELVRFEAHEKIVQIIAEADERFVLALSRRSDGTARALRIDAKSGALSVLAESSRWPSLRWARTWVRISHVEHGFVYLALLDDEPFHTGNRLVFTDRDRDGEIEDVVQLTNAEFDAVGYEREERWDGCD